MLIYAKGLRASCCPPDTGSHSMLMTFEYPKQTDSYSARCRSALRQGNPSKSSWHFNENKWDDQHYHCNRRLHYLTLRPFERFSPTSLLSPRHARSLARSIDADGNGNFFRLLLPDVDGESKQPLRSKELLLPFLLRWSAHVSSRSFPFAGELPFIHAARGKRLGADRRRHRPTSLWHTLEQFPRWITASQKYRLQSGTLS